MLIRTVAIAAAIGLSTSLIAAEGGSLGPSSGGAAAAAPAAGSGAAASQNPSAPAAPASSTSKSGGDGAPGNVRNPAIRGSTLGGGPEDAFNSLDRDKDGEISQDEGDQDSSLSSNRDFEQADVNKDGRLDPSEHSQTR